MVVDDHFIDLPVLPKVFVFLEDLWICQARRKAHHEHQVTLDHPKKKKKKKKKKKGDVTAKKTHQFHN